MLVRPEMVPDEMYEKAEAIYWAVVETLGVENICIEAAEGGGTKNTELGEELYFQIESILTGE